MTGPTHVAKTVTDTDLKVEMNCFPNPFTLSR